MARASFPSDTIAIKDISTGGNNAGNGGEGHNSGNISSHPNISFNPSNKADGADVDVKTGDQVHQKAYWDAGGANAKAEWFAKANGGEAESNGDQKSYSGHNTSDVDATTTAYQTNFVLADQSQSVAAGIGGNGGHDSTAKGGDVDIKASIESVNLNDVLNNSGHHPVDDYGHV
ncbi:hypothetical protein [Bradyrhizobium sp. URHD0069]|jgi:hypothetical protein|uniref:hypothetical protein n=1 Tax=Bradyrhizobium sp. URHD0069 TaxID=1380355 RepID=UPI0004956D43|nr:hypothetical protein [Bradyrhizobium sp. URHD0069]